MDFFSLLRSLGTIGTAGETGRWVCEKEYEEAQVLRWLRKVDEYGGSVIVICWLVVLRDVVDTCRNL